MGPEPSQTDVVILCGGLGTRLHSVVSDRPKPMALVDGRPFLDILLSQFTRAGFRRFVLCTGHQSKSVRDHFCDPGPDLDVTVSEEPHPLGTAGAIKNAEPLLNSTPFLVCNGDSFCQIDFNAFLDFHYHRQALLSIALAPANDPRDYGMVMLEADDRISAFSEKGQSLRPGIVNAGIYLFERKVLGRIPSGRKVSLEEEVFPALAGDKCFGYRGASSLLDIGTPDRYRKASTYFAERA